MTNKPDEKTAAGNKLSAIRLWFMVLQGSFSQASSPRRIRSRSENPARLLQPSLAVILSIPPVLTSEANEGLPQFEVFLLNLPSSKQGRF